MELERITSPSRRHRRRSWLAIVGVIGLLVGSAQGLRSRDEVRVVTVVRDEVVAVPYAVPIVSERVAAPPPTPVVLPAQRGARAACPPPRRDAPMATLPELDDSMLEYVVPAPTNAGWIAAWGSSGLYVSDDAGETFTRVHGADAAWGIDDVTFDCYGRVVVVAGGKLGIYAAGTLTWLVDYQGEFATLSRYLIGGGPDIVIVHEDDETNAVRLEMSRDLGATWSDEVVWPVFDAIHRSLTASGHQAADGTIRLVLTADPLSLDDDTGKTEVREVVVRSGTLRVESGVGTATDNSYIAPGPIERYGRIDLAVGADGADGVWWRRDHGAWQRVAALPTADGATTLVPGPWPAVVIGGGLYRIDHGKARRVFDWPAEEGRTSTEPAAIDLAGRVWAIESRGGGDCDGTFRPVLLGRAAR